MRRNRGVSVAELVKELNAVIRGWINYFKKADMKCIIEEITSHLNRMLRCYIWKQWKLSKTRKKNLIKLGISEETAHVCAYSRKGYWRNSKTPIIHLAISDERLKRKGLIFPIDHYLKVHEI